MDLRHYLAAVGISVVIGLAAISAGSDLEPKIDLADFVKLPKDAKAALESAEQYELYSLDPRMGILEKEDEAFHGWNLSERK